MEHLDEILDLTDQLARLCSTLHRDQRRELTDARCVAGDDDFPFEQAIDGLDVRG